MPELIKGGYEAILNEKPIRMITEPFMLISTNDMFVGPILIGVAVIVPALLYINKVISMWVAILVAALVIMIYALIKTKIIYAELEIVKAYEAYEPPTSLV